MTWREMFPVGAQILYVPTEAKGDPNHHAVEAGWVVAHGRSDPACRYWSGPDTDGAPRFSGAKTTTWRLLVRQDTVPQEQVEAANAKIAAATEAWRNFGLHLTGSGGA